MRLDKKKMKEKFDTGEEKKNCAGKRSGEKIE